MASFMQSFQPSCWKNHRLVAALLPSTVVLMSLSTVGLLAQSLPASQSFQQRSLERQQVQSQTSVQTATHYQNTAAQPLPRLKSDDGVSVCVSEAKLVSVYKEPIAPSAKIGAETADAPSVPIKVRSTVVTAPRNYPLPEQQRAPH
jgi:hypothetical protein